MNYSLNETQALEREKKVAIIFNWWYYESKFDRRTLLSGIGKKIMFMLALIKPMLLCETVITE